MTLVHSTKWQHERNASFAFATSVRPRRCSLGSAEDRLYPLRTVSGEAKNVQVDVGVRLGRVDMRAGPRRRDGISTSGVLSVPVLSAARAARDRSRAAPL